jgi:hypothetical protein
MDRYTDGHLRRIGECFHQLIHETYSWMSLSDYGEASCECGFFTHVDQRTSLGEVRLFWYFMGYGSAPALR